MDPTVRTTRAVGWCLRVTTPSGQPRYLAGAGNITRSREHALMWPTEEAAEAAIAAYKTGPLASREFIIRRHWAPDWAARWAS